MLFHAGVLLRLAEFGYLGSTERQGKHGPLDSLQRVPSGSRGSITSAVLAFALPSQKGVDGSGLRERFRRQMIDPVQRFGSQSTICTGSDR